MEVFNELEKVLHRGETALLWVGALTTASLTLWMLYRLLSGFRIWVLGNGDLLSPKLGKWAGEFNPFIHSGGALQQLSQLNLNATERSAETD